MNRKITSKKIALAAIYTALIAVLTFTPLGMFPIIPGVISTAFVILVVVILAIQLEGLWLGVWCSAVFGVCSFINSYLNASLMAYCFQNPLVSVLPRIVIGFTGYFGFKFFKKIFSKSQKKFVNTALPSALGAAVSVITNTVLVLGLILMLYGGDAVNEITMRQLIFGTIALINFPVELIVCSLVVPPVYAALNRYKKKSVKEIN